MNAGTVNSITGDFIGNYTQSSEVPNTLGAGEIMNAGIINSITGDFIGNCVQNTTEKSEYDRALARGGAVLLSQT